MQRVWQMARATKLLTAQHIQQQCICMHGSTDQGLGHLRQLRSDQAGCIVHACIPAQSRQALPLSAQQWQLPGTFATCSRCALTAACEWAVERVDCPVAPVICSHNMHDCASSTVAFYRLQELPITWTATVMHIVQIWAVLQTLVPSWHQQHSVYQSTASFPAGEILPNLAVQSMVRRSSDCMVTH